MQPRGVLRGGKRDARQVQVGGECFDDPLDVEEVVLRRLHSLRVVPCAGHATAAQHDREPPRLVGEFLLSLRDVHEAEFIHGDGVRGFDNSTVRLDLDNEPQPDLVLIKLPAKGGQARISGQDYIEGAPELAVEIVASSRAYDLHQKKGAYRRNGVREYLAWITGEKRLVWWELQDEQYQEIAPSAEALLKSRIFPGLWLDTAALLRGDMKGVLAALRRGLVSPEHGAFAAK